MDKELSGKPIANAINKVSKTLVTEHSLKPKMLLIQIGEDPASAYYVHSIIRTAAKLGCEAELLRLDNTCNQHELIKIISKANIDASIHGIMIQKPLPRDIDDSVVNLNINPDKDLDALNPLNLGKILMENEAFLPCTPAAVYYTMKYYGIDPQGRNTVILGRSNVVGKPLANMLLWKRPFANATVTICHSKTKDLASICRNADILISAIGKAKFVGAEMVKDNAILIDVGINELIDADGNVSYVGDIDFEACYSKSYRISPVPGGIGRITTSLLYLNLVKANLIALKVNKNVDEYIDTIFSENQK
ncbi:MAG: tetrahydrofolate dehydrogenase/cyclohydrolase catalytic domain-containing protein [Candidatus Cloacimonetes bacterium]|nr:bifunctional 5,10-methylenetetrahydrofolate dehydrogenase/5,10-methenyltetrahydrofolate cyclohydrolase [Candidatus Cloacimonadota bacterium]MCB5278236.1 bifunctional 5,10-methylenetetrahydrofolate dehydrogenase/5,10-methenyltetrahydrofolate cyclohydrolase [Candidatus Cloacimonadota bacterium]MDD2210981.1 tetrahydrofolate dehydrogenase/cyclohydrolase catalytic domain-containing protein [Candidatus Cloacimonadota bacterium]MDD3282132.1 tetrahydrofolate dehydrogenase/cyclohydrolase catalytic dom